MCSSTVASTANSSNATVTVPGFVLGATSPIVVTGTKIDQSQVPKVELPVEDDDGNAALCDPLMVTVSRDTGKPVVAQTHGFSWRRKQAADPDRQPWSDDLQIQVNGTKFEVAGLNDNEARKLDVSRAIVAGGQQHHHPDGAGQARRERRGADLQLNTRGRGFGEALQHSLMLPA